MAWRDPTPFERNLLEDVRDRWPEILPLARHLCLSPRVEPLLMRNVRHRFVPHAPTEIESLLWFSPLVAARSTREIVFHLGVARLLADEFLSEPDATTRLESLWQYTCRHTRHWSVEDRLERDLRYHALRAEGADVREKLQTILRRLRQETDAEQRLKLSRLVKRALPVIGPAFADMQEARWLAQYAAQALGDAGAWANPGPPTAPPGWLAEKLPAPQAASELSVEIRHDSQHGQVLHFLAPQADLPTLRFAHPLPARLHIAPEGEVGAWYPVAIGVRIPIQPASPRLTLTTLEGTRWDFRTQALPIAESDGPVQPILWLVHVEADREQAEALAHWLAGQGLEVRLLPETQAAAVVEAAADTRILRLWTQAAKRHWTSSPAQPPTSGGVLLRIEEVDLPGAGAPGGLLDWRDWQRFGDSPDARRLLESLTRWLEHGEVPPAPGESADANPDDEEIARLLAEIDNPETTPPRRLEIGDRLAELGDPRPGVGVVEIEVVLNDDADNQSPSISWPNATEAMTRTEEESVDEIDRIPLLETDEQISKAIENAFLHAGKYGPPQLRAALARWRKSKPSDIAVYTGRGPAMLSVSDGGLGGFEADSTLKSYSDSNHLFADVFGGAKLRWPILFFLSKANPPGVNATTTSGVVSIIQLGRSYSLFDVTLAVSQALTEQDVYLVRAWFIFHLRRFGMSERQIASLHGFGILPKAVLAFLEENKQNILNSHAFLVFRKGADNRNLDLLAIAEALGIANSSYGVLRSDARKSFQLQHDERTYNDFATADDLSNQLEMANLAAILGEPSIDFGLWKHLAKGCFDKIRTVLMVATEDNGAEVLDLPVFFNFRVFEIDGIVPVGQHGGRSTNVKANSMFDDDTTPSDEHFFGGLWTLQKLQALEKYLKAFNNALSRQSFTRVYIDAFAGTGRVTVKAGEGNNVIDGSARRALKVEPAFDHYCFIELQTRKVTALNVLAEEYPDKSIAIIQEDANVALKKVCQQYDWRGTRAVLFLDPYGFHVDWSTLEAIAATKAIDVWYLFPYSGLYRQMARKADAIDPDKAAAITRILGTDEWRQRFLAPPRQSELFDHKVSDEREGNHEALLEFVSERLGGLFPAVTKPKVFYQGGDARNPKGAPLFALYFAAANPDPKAFGLATRIAQDVLNAL